jgi:transcriptional regulator with GAF, ATPase, and Fis domain
VRGAFTGAVADRRGKFSCARRHDFLDETAT